MTAASEAAHESVSVRLVSRLRLRCGEVDHVFGVVVGRRPAASLQRCNVGQPASAAFGHRNRLDGVESSEVDVVLTVVSLTDEQRCQLVIPEDV